VVAIPKPLRRVRVSTESHRVTTFELFFDLVFVFAFTQVTRLMAHEHSAWGVLQGMVILGLLWWSWVSYSWLSNHAHVDEGIMRSGILVAMAAMFLAALAIPEAFDDLEGGLSGPLVLAVAYTVVRIMHSVLYFIAADEDAALRRQVLKTSIAMILGCSLIIAGALIGEPVQLWFWMAGLAIDFVLTYTTSKGGDWRLHSAAHWSERYGLVVILALGESIVAIGVGASQLPVDTAILIGSIFGIGLSLCLWWLYFDMVALEAERVLAKLQGKARASLAVDAYTYVHLLLIAGIVISALGVETALAHIDEPADFGWLGASTLIGGTALYLVGHAAFWKRVGNAWEVWRLGAALLLVALVPVAAVMAPLAAMGVVFGICGALVALETLLYAEKRARVRGAV
jgi:low temperature requirement protein LtrA